jgi:hypothetical protein
MTALPAPGFPRPVTLSRIKFCSGGSLRPAPKRLREACRFGPNRLPETPKFASNADSLSERFRAGERISSCLAESTVNAVISKRFAKRQQMQWTPRGAHLLLQARTRTFDGTLRPLFERWFPGLANNNTAEVGSTAASVAPPILMLPRPPASRADGSPGLLGRLHLRLRTRSATLWRNLEAGPFRHRRLPRASSRLRSSARRCSRRVARFAARLPIS